MKDFPKTMHKENRLKTFIFIKCVIGAWVVKKYEIILKSRPTHKTGKVRRRTALYR